MLRNCFLTFVTFLCLISCGSGVGYKIEGKLTNLKDPWVYIVYEGSGDNLMDSIECTPDGKFKFTRTQEGFNSATLFFEKKTKHTTLFLESENKISINGDMNYPLLFQIKGGKINEELSAFYKKISPLVKEQADLSEMLYLKEENAIGDTDLTSKLRNVNHQIEESVLAYICDNPQKESAAVLLHSYFLIPDDVRKLDELLAVLDPQLNDFYLVKDMVEYSLRAKRTAIGAEAPDFSVKNVYGKPLTLDSLSSNYKLLAFIAPWCEMCQTDMLSLDKVASKYKKEDLDILLISLDNDHSGVRDLLKKDTIKWNLVTDSANQAAMLLDLYNVSALPRCFLIDEDDKIILKTDNGVEISQTLGNLIDKTED